MDLHTDIIRELLADKRAIVVISAVGQDGNPYTEVSRKLVLNESGRLEYYEFLETSQLQKNLVYSLWFEPMSLS